MRPKTSDPRDFTDGAEPWRAAAACRTVDTALFFPSATWAGSRPHVGHGSTVVDRQIEAAKSVCATCPVRPDCLDYALAANEPEGVWGGTDPVERRAIRKGRRLAS